MLKETKMDIRVTFPGNKKVDAEIHGYTINTDQPIAAGGDGTAPAPFEYFLASLATCAGIYALEFINQRGLSSQGLLIEVALERDPVKRLINKVAFHVHLPAGFPEKYKAALINTINLCTVKKHLQNPPEFETILVSESK
jgi:putative redox protein